MNLVIDSGNSFTKAGFFQNGKLRHFMEEVTADDLPYLFHNYNPDKIIVSSVNDRFTLPDTDIPVLWFDHETPVPVKNEYRTPETLGLDRLAGVAGALYLYPESDCLIIDAGTCITMDFVSKEGIYAGGSISPGIKMRFRALKEFTDRLPLTELKINPPLTGGNTEESIQSGVINGFLEEVKGMIRNYQEKNWQMKVLLTGGDSLFLSEKLPEGILAVPQLVLIGLNRILEYNNDNKNI